jgi:hypothetical protein
MATRNHTSPKNRQSEAVPTSQGWCPDRKNIAYIDDARDFRDLLLLDAIKAAIQLIEDADEPLIACNVLRLARDRLEACWPKTNVKFTAEVQLEAEVAHG